VCPQCSIAANLSPAVGSVFSSLAYLTGKSTKDDKKLYRVREEAYAAEAAFSPPDSILGTSPFGPLSDATSRRTAANLISVLNLAFPDYDFSQMPVQSFSKVRRNSAPAGQWVCFVAGAASRPYEALLPHSLCPGGKTGGCGQQHQRDARRGCAGLCDGPTTAALGSH
jgi:Maf1 regulator